MLTIPDEECIARPCPACPAPIGVYCGMLAGIGPAVHERRLLKPKVVFSNGHKVTGQRQMEALERVTKAGAYGMTARELGQAVWGTDTSGKSRAGAPLSLLHEAGVLAMLAKEREGHHVYVLPEMVLGRETVTRKRHHCPGCRCGEDQ